MAVGISIITPSFNTPQRYLHDAAISLALQDDPKNVEWIIIDDHSDSQHRRQLHDTANWASNDLGLEVRLEENHGERGPGATRNVGIAVAKAPYIGVLDSDDALEKGAVTRTLDAARRNPKADLIFTDHARLDEGLEQTLYEKQKSKWFSLHSVHKGTLADPQYALCFVGHFTVLRAATLRSIGGYKNIRGEDYDLHLRLAAHTPDVNFVHVPETLFHYRKNPSSLQHDKRTLIIDGTRDLLLNHLRTQGVPAMDVRYEGRECGTLASFYTPILREGPVERPYALPSLTREEIDG